MRKLLKCLIGLSMVATLVCVFMGAFTLSFVAGTAQAARGGHNHCRCSAGFGRLANYRSPSCDVSGMQNQLAETKATEQLLLWENAMLRTEVERLVKLKNGVPDSCGNVRFPPGYFAGNHL